MIYSEFICQGGHLDSCLVRPVGTCSTPLVPPTKKARSTNTLLPQPSSVLPAPLSAAPFPLHSTRTGKTIHTSGRGRWGHPQSLPLPVTARVAHCSCTLLQLGLVVALAMVASSALPSPRTQCPFIVSVTPMQTPCACPACLPGTKYTPTWVYPKASIPPLACRA